MKKTLLSSLVGLFFLTLFWVNSGKIQSVVTIKEHLTGAQTSVVAPDLKIPLEIQEAKKPSAKGQVKKKKTFAELAYDANTKTQAT